ncbi:hypothetical protein [Legionella sp.]|uniref:hypothetical protein n=1 Tax=Legionella sp. TaxID=459 RepID=UPI003CC5E994
MTYQAAIFSGGFCSEHSSEIEPSPHTIKPEGALREGGGITPPRHKQQPLSNCKSIMACGVQ